jgi:fermentation-respiration switch protein FrsA (DUF1100 family)
MRTDIEFDADATTLRGWLYTPGLGDPPYPTVIMAHGLTARKEHGLDAYAEVFSAAGLAVLVYDNRNLGASDGQPRGEVDPSAQLRDYGHAITHASGLYEFFAGFASLGVLGWENKLTIRSLWLRLEYDALSFVDRVSPTPMLMIVATDDSITPTSIALRTFDRALEPKKLVMIEGHHYQPYLDGFPQSSSAARDWFVEHLATS